MFHRKYFLDTEPQRFFCFAFIVQAQSGTVLARPRALAAVWVGAAPQGTEQALAPVHENPESDRSFLGMHKALVQLLSASCEFWETGP